MRVIRLFGLSSVIWAVLGAQTLAMCIWFVPPGRSFEPAKNIKTLVSQSGDSQTLVVQPQFRGTATDFALVMPFPSQPELDEAPRNIFKQLEDLTNPVQEFDQDFSGSASLDAGVAENQPRAVEVIEVRDVGEYTATTLSARDASELVEWLNTNDYDVPDEKLDILDQYIGEESSFFVALKINASNADVDSSGLLRGELNPIQFTFSSPDVMLPLRLMADAAGDVFDLVIYTLGDEQRYVPGAEIQFARKVTGADIDDTPSLKKYDAERKWLTRNAISLDSSKIEKDLTFYTTPADVVVEVGDEAVRVNPELLDPKTGLIEATEGTIRYVEDQDSDDLQPSALVDDQTRPLIVITILLGIANIFLINSVLKLRAKQTGEADE